MRAVGLCRPCACTVLCADCWESCTLCNLVAMLLAADCWESSLLLTPPCGISKSIFLYHRCLFKTCAIRGFCSVPFGFLLNLQDGSCCPRCLLLNTREALRRPRAPRSSFLSLNKSQYVLLRVVFSGVLVRSEASRNSAVPTWLILPVVICLSQRLSHACLSISFYTAKLRMAH